MKRFLNPDTHQTVTLEEDGRGRDRVHMFDLRDIDAVNAAIAARRPLLIKGEPGTGKSQLARAAAKALKWRFARTAVSAATEPEGLLYELDAVERLAEAQVIQVAAPKDLGSDEERRAWVKAQLEVGQFLKPGVLWWGFNWAHANAQSQGRSYQADKDSPPDGPAVILIDEIDKADPAVPNSLLDALGRGAFDVPGGKVRCHPDCAPLIVVTSNDERAMPAAFLRRCLVLHLSLPTTEDAFIELLTRRALAHLSSGGHVPDPNKKASKGDDKKRNDAGALLKRAAGMLWRDREQAKAARLATPGQAEFLDLAWALFEMGDTHTEREALLERLTEFTFDKHRLRAPASGSASGASDAAEDFGGRP